MKPWHQISGGVNEDLLHLWVYGYVPPKKRQRKNKRQRQRRVARSERVA